MLIFVAGFAAALLIGALAYGAHRHWQNGYVGLTTQQARTQAVRFLRKAHPRTTLVLDDASEGFDDTTGENAWVVVFNHPERAQSGFGSLANSQPDCTVFVRSGVSHFARRCSA